MVKKNISKEVINVVKTKTGKKISETDIQKIANGVKPTTVQSDTQLRQLIKQVSTMANVPVSESTMKEIIHAVQSSGINTDSVESLMKTLLK